MQLILLDADPSKISMRSRDTEHMGSGTHDPGPWSAWEPLSALEDPSRDVPAEFMLAYLAAAQLVRASVASGGSTVVVSTNVNGPDGTPVRTIDCELRAAA